MDRTPNAETVGRVIRELREKNGLSVRTLAGRAGVSPAFISQVENGQASPSIASLERIAHELGVTLGGFFNQGAITSSPHIVRAGSRDEWTSEWSRARVESLGPVGHGHRLEAMLFTLEPSGRTGSRPSSYLTEAFAFVSSGVVTLVLEAEQQPMQQGDAVTIPAQTPHRWENTSQKTASLVVVLAR